MLFTLLGAELAGVGAGAELSADEFPVGGGEAGDNPGGSETNISAVEIGADARDLVGDLVLSKAGIGAGIAGFGAGVGCDDALNGAGVIGIGVEGMRLEHLFDVAHVFTSRTSTEVRVGTSLR